jgi:sporulation protein YlmC with PRC-barrel domain
VIVSLSDLVGRTVRDADGRPIGQIEELMAEIELHTEGNDYVVTEVAVGGHRMIDMIVSGWFVPDLIKRWRKLVGYRRYEIPWDWLDLRDPGHPRLLRPVAELRADD